MREWKVPKDEKICPGCDLPYGFITCRITIHTKTGTKNLCTRCAIDEQNSQSKEMFEVSDDQPVKYTTGYPKRIIVDCYCHLTTQTYMARPAPELCARCKKWQDYFNREYLMACKNLGIEPTPLDVDLFAKAPGVESLQTG